MAAPSTGSTTCTDNSLAGKTITTNLTVPAGVTCDLSWSTIKGNVTVAGHLQTYGIARFEKNVSVVQGGSYEAGNWGVTINGNLSFVNPATNSGNGFWGNQGGTSSEVKGNLSYTITSDMVYPQYQSPYLYFGGGTKVDGNFTFSTGGRIGEPGSGGIKGPDTTGLQLIGSQNIS